MQRMILRKRGKRKLLYYVWFVVCLTSLYLCLVVSTIWGSFSGKQTRSTEATLRGKPCEPASLPPSIQLHCRMYQKNLITGTLCSPLCDQGHVCDVTSTYGNAHKEVMVTQCHAGVCGQAGRAILKHDEVYATATEGYDKFYSTANATSGSADGWKESLTKLLHRHLPNASITDTFLSGTLEEWSLLLRENTPDLAVYNSLTQLFRQKEYVLFQAYKHSGVFPKVYGACGPLYLVEFCDPILQQDRRYNKAFVLNDSPDSNTVKPIDETERRQEASYDTQSVLLFDRQSATHDHTLKPESFFLHEGQDKPFRERLKTDVRENFLLETFSRGKLMLPSEIEVKNSGGDKVYVVNLDSDDDSRPSWSDRAAVAIKIFHFLEHLEREETFPEHIHLCDPKLEHFAVGKDDGKLKLIDADLVLFDFNMAPESSAPEVDTGACSKHEDCSDVMCRGWCWKEMGRCASRRVNNNLQGICENVFLRPSLEYGTVFTAIPAAVYDDVSKLLCQCAVNVTGLWEGVPLKLPSASTRERLVSVLGRSLRTENSPGLKIQIGLGGGGGGNEDFDFLSEYCKSFR